MMAPATLPSRAETLSTLTFRTQVPVGGLEEEGFAQEESSRSAETPRVMATAARVGVSRVFTLPL